MKYQFVCPDCGHVQVEEHSHEELQALKESGVPCENCESTSQYAFDPSGVQVCFKGFQWADKNFKEKEYRNKRSKYMAARQKKNNYTPKLAPNYKGERTSSWKEARAEAQSDGKFAETYDHLVREEEAKP
jgi:transcription elongation factor Elf1